MKISLDSTIKAIDGSVVRDGDVDLTLKTVCVRALSTPLDTDRNGSPETVVTRWRLAMRLQLGGEQNITPEEASELRARIAKVFVLEAAGPALVALEG